MPHSQSKTDILSLSPNELIENIGGFGVPTYRATQVFDWLHKKNVKSFYDMTNLPQDLRSLLALNFAINSAKCQKKLVSKIDGTEKYLFELHDGVLIETVVMKYRFGKSICISTQAGCKMGCTFCASGETGLRRNLTAGEMLAQVYAADAVKRVVLMGCGEPLDNYENVLRFLELISHEQGKNIGERNITLSTCGIVPKINELAILGKQINLAISLHAPSDELRTKLMPIARAHPIHELIESAKHYAKTTKRRITYEYSLIDGINDDAAHAIKVAVLLKNSLCHVNLIPINKTSSGLSPSTLDKVSAFYKTLESYGIQTTIRRSIGADINAACGQLRNGFTDTASSDFF